MGIFTGVFQGTEDHEGDLLARRGFLVGGRGTLVTARVGGAASCPQDQGNCEKGSDVRKRSERRDSENKDAIWISFNSMFLFSLLCLLKI